MAAWPRLTRLKRSGQSDAKLIPTVDPLFRTPLVIATALAVAFGLGILSSVYALRATVGFGAIALGPWTSFPAAQTIDADPYAKAHRARDGRLLLGGAEGLAFTAATDSDNRTLVENCRYEINEAEAMMRREGIKWLSSTHKSIEEIATTILQEIKLDRPSY